VGIGVAFVVGTVVLDRHGPHIPMMEFRREDYVRIQSFENSVGELGSGLPDSRFLVE
jgi:hypothetical protein